MLDDLNIVGTSWRQDQTINLQQYLLEEQGLHNKLEDFKIRHGLSGIAYLSTCNRIEIIYSSTQYTEHKDLRPFIFELLTGNKPAPGEARKKLRAWHSEGACEHIFLVTSGLDSAALGETEITGQVKKCKDLFLRNNLIGQRLDLLFEQALKVSANVREATGISRGKTSLSEISIIHIKNHYDTHKEPIALVGMSDVIKRVAKSLHEINIPFFFINRTVNNIKQISNKYNTKYISLEKFLYSPDNFSCLFSSTSSDNYIFDKSFLEKFTINGSQPSDKLFIDMSLTYDVDPKACDILGINRIGLDQINNEAKENHNSRLNESAIAREIIDKALLDFPEVYAERIYAPVFSILQDRYLYTAQEGLKKLMKKELKGIGNKEKDAIKVWCTSLAKRFAHIPSVGIRGLIHKGPEGSLDAFLEGVDEDFAKELKSVLNLQLEQDDKVIK
jgi:glutamyl-tRNA reductase|tara:strand:+ start:61822 stop:63156 length:1335 start_codon:yes stop_codon:yes gene_type:complete